MQNLILFFSYKDSSSVNNIFISLRSLVRISIKVLSWDLIALVFIALLKNTKLRPSTYIFFALNVLGYST